MGSCCSGKESIDNQISDINSNVIKINKNIVIDLDNKDKKEENDKWLLAVYSYKDVKPFIPPVEKGIVIKVYDGDSFTIATKIYDQIYRFPIRVNGLDTAELKSVDKKSKKMAILAKDKVTKLILGKVVYLKNVKVEKYGRLLCDVYINDVNIELNITKWLIDSNLAIPYNGKKKEDIKIWSEIYDKHWKEYWESYYNEF